MNPGKDQSEIRLNNADICALAAEGLRSQGVPVVDNGIELDCGDDSPMNHGREIMVIATVGNTAEGAARRPSTQEFRQDRLHEVVLEALGLTHLSPNALRFYHDPTAGVTALVNKRPNMA